MARKNGKQTTKGGKGTTAHASASVQAESKVSRKPADRYSDAQLRRAYRRGIAGAFGDNLSADSPTDLQGARKGTMLAWAGLLDALGPDGIAQASGEGSAKPSTAAMVPADIPRHPLRDVFAARAILKGIKQPTPERTVEWAKRIAADADRFDAAVKQAKADQRAQKEAAAAQTVSKAAELTPEEIIALAKKAGLTLVVESAPGAPVTTTVVDGQTVASAGE